MYILVHNLLNQSLLAGLVYGSNGHYFCDSLPLPTPPPAVAAVAAILFATVAFNNESRGEGCVAVVDEGEAERKVGGGVISDDVAGVGTAGDPGVSVTSLGDSTGLIPVCASVVLLVVVLTAEAGMEEQVVEEEAEVVVGAGLFLGTPGMCKTVERGREKSSSDVNLQE